MTTFSTIPSPVFNSFYEKKSTELEISQGNYSGNIDELISYSTQPGTPSPLEIECFVTAMFRLGTELDLKHLKNSIRISELSNTGKMLMIKYRNPACSFVIYPNGVGICYEASNEEDALLASRKIARTIQKLGYNVKFTNFRILNISYRMSLGKELDLEKIHGNTELKVRYEPEVCDGAYVQIGAMTFFLQRDGTVIVSGANPTVKVNEIIEAINYITNSDFSI